MSVILRKRKNADGTTSLRLDIFHNGQRLIETLKHLKLAKPSNLLDREQNKKRMQQAEEIAVSRAAQLEANNYNMTSDAGKKTIVTVWMQSYVDGYTKKDKRNMQGALNRFKAFLIDEKATGLTFGNLDALLIEDFVQYLENNSTGEGASSYYARFKKMIKQAYRKRLMVLNVLDQVERKPKGKAKKKDILTIEELATLSSTPIENEDLRRSFLFSCMTGLRWADVKTLQWKSISLPSKQMTIQQTKTGEYVSIPLNDTAVRLLETGGDPDNLVFKLPTANGANKTLKAWVKRAKIDKCITYHCSRHSYGSNLIYNNVDILTVSKLMGHTTMKHTQRYVTTANEMKERATNTINFDL